MKHQKGISFPIFVFALAMFFMAILLCMRVVPIYIEHFAVVDTLKSVQQLPPNQTMATSIRDKIMRHFSINDVKNVKRENIKIKKARGGYNVSVAYEVRFKLLGNIDAVIHFNDVVKVGHSEQAAR